MGFTSVNAAYPVGYTEQMRSVAVCRLVTGLRVVELWHNHLVMIGIYNVR
jgi:hypothetical protein